MRTARAAVTAATKRNIQIKKPEENEKERMRRMITTKTTPTTKNILIPMGTRPQPPLMIYIDVPPSIYLLDLLD